MYARDGGLPPNFAKAVVRVEVQDLNDNAPVFAKSSYGLEVPENQEPVELCFLKATDPDSGPGGELEYRITGKKSFCVSNPSVLLEWNKGDLLYIRGHSWVCLYNVILYNFHVQNCKFADSLL